MVNLDKTLGEIFGKTEFECLEKSLYRNCPEYKDLEFREDGYSKTIPTFEKYLKIKH